MAGYRSAGSGGCCGDIPFPRWSARHFICGTVMYDDISACAAGTWATCRATSPAAHRYTVVFAAALLTPISDCRQHHDCRGRDGARQQSDPQCGFQDEHDHHERAQSCRTQHQQRALQAVQGRAEPHQGWQHSDSRMRRHQKAGTGWSGRAIVAAE